MTIPSPGPAATATNLPGQDTDGRLGLAGVLATA